MKYLKKYNTMNENSTWDNVEGQFDVFQLMELLIFIYGKEMFKEIIEELDAYEDDYNPDEYYDQIRYILEQNNVLEDFLENLEAYSIKKDENDPFHWRYKQKQQEEFNRKFNDLL